MGVGVGVGKEPWFNSVCSRAVKDREAAHGTVAIYLLKLISSQLANCMPLPLPRPHCTRLSTSSHPYSVHLPNASLHQYVHSFIPILSIFLMQVYRYFTLSDRIVCFIINTLLYYSRLFGNIIVVTSVTTDNWHYRTRVSLT